MNRAARRRALKFPRPRVQMSVSHLAEMMWRNLTEGSTSRLASVLLGSRIRDFLGCCLQFAESDSLRESGISEQRRNSPRRRRIKNPFREITLEPGDIVPRSELVPDSVIHTDLGEADCAVQSLAGRVWQRDSGVRVPVSLQRQHREQRRVERAACSTPVCILIDVRTNIHAPLVGQSVAMSCRIGVAQNRAVNLAD